MDTQNSQVEVTPIYPFKKSNLFVYVRVYFKKDRDRRYISSGVKVNDNEWDFSEKCLFRTLPSSVYVPKQKKIDDLIYRVGYVLKKLEFENKALTKENFNLEWLGGEKHETVKNQKPLHQVLLQVLISEPIADTTKKAYKNTIRLVKKFRETLTFSEISYKLAKDWDKFLKDEFSNSNTRAGHHKVFRTLLSDCQKEGMFPREQLEDYDQFDRPKIEGSRQALIEELKSIEELEFPKFSLMDNIQKRFLMGCYTGLRISDIRTLRKEHLDYKDSRGLMIHKPIEKLKNVNGMVVHLPVEKLFDGKPAKIIEYYKDYLKDTDLVLPHYADQTTNRYLKVLANHAKIKIPLSFHYSRHTFCTIIAMLTKNVWGVMEYGGIKSLNTAQNYVHNAKKLIDEDLEGVTWDL